MLDKDWLSTCAPFGSFNSTDQSWTALGAGVFIYDEPYVWYVTANHIRITSPNATTHILVKHSKTQHCFVDISSLHKKHNITWLVDEGSDLAATLFPVEPEFIIKAINFPYFMNINDMNPSMTCYSISYPYNLAGFDIEKVEPHVQNGIISAIDAKQKRIYVTTPTFPGNKGCPLFILKEPQNGNHTLNKAVVYFGGIICDYIVTGKNQISPTDISLPPLHLGAAIPAEDIRKLLESPYSQKIKKKIKKL